MSYEDNYKIDDHDALSNSANVISYFDLKFSDLCLDYNEYLRS